MKVVVEIFLQEIAHKLVHAYSVFAYGQTAELYLCLAFKLRLVDVYCYCRHNAVSYVLIVEVFSVELFQRFRHVFFERTLVSSAHRGVLSVDKRIIFFAILCRMGERNLYVLTRKMDYGIERGRCHVVDKKILESVAALYFPPVEHNHETGIQICVVSQHCLYELRVETIVLEQRVVGTEVNISSVLFRCFFGGIAYEFSLFKHCRSHFSVAAAAHLVARTHGINSL